MLQDHREVRRERATPTFRTRAIAIKEERAELVKHHLDVLWHDYFKPEHLEKVPNLHELFWNATKQVTKVKASTDLADAKKLLDMIDEIDAAWKATGGEEKTRVARPAQLIATPLTSSRRAARSAPASGCAARGGSPSREASMRPAIEPGDWLLVDPTIAPLAAARLGRRLPRARLRRARDQAGRRPARAIASSSPTAT